MRTELSPSLLRNWGTERERAIYARFSASKRRYDWLLGRLVCKSLIREFCFNHCDTTLSFAEIDIVNDALGKPTVHFVDPVVLLPDIDRFSISISHSNARAFCALSEHPAGTGFGVDLEKIGPRPALFAETFLADAEQLFVQRAAVDDKEAIITAFWSIKEAFLKAIGTGLRVDTRRIQVELTPPPWPEWTQQSMPSTASRHTGCRVMLKQSGAFIEAVVWLENAEMWKRSLGQPTTLSADGVGVSATSTVCNQKSFEVIRT